MGAITAAMVFAGAFALCWLFIIRRMNRLVEAPLSCGECGDITEDLTDDDVCFRCDYKLSRFTADPKEVERG